MSAKTTRPKVLTDIDGAPVLCEGMTWRPGRGGYYHPCRLQARYLRERWVGKDKWATPRCARHLKGTFPEGSAE